jgi:hypothetical protein
MIQVVAYLQAFAVIAGTQDLAFLDLGHVLVVATKRGNDGVAACLVVVVGFAHDCSLQVKKAGGRGGQFQVG